MIIKISKKIACIYLFVSIAVIVSSSLAFAQEIQTWSTQQRIPGYENDASDIVLINDQNQVVHAFSSQWTTDDSSNKSRVIMYNRWVPNQGWTKPINILVSPFKNDARLMDVKLDQSGMVHLVFWGGDNTQAKIYYSTVPISKVGNAQAWAIPTLVSENAQDPESGRIYIDGKKQIKVLFAGIISGKGLYETSSTDQGTNWSKPLLISSVHENTNSIFNLDISASDNGVLHEIWIEYNQDGQGRGLYYNNLNVTDDSWRGMIKLASAESGLGIMNAGIISYNDSVFTIYNLAGTITMRKSDDQGETWSYPSVLFPKFAGVNGSLSLLIDNSNKLHLFFGQRKAGNPDIHGLWHSIWETQYWTQPDPVVSGPLVVDKVGDEGFDPYDAQAIVSQRNTMLVIWHTDYASNQNGVWYSYTTLVGHDILITPVPPEILKHIKR